MNSISQNLIKEIKKDSIDNFFYLPIEQNPLGIIFTDKENNIIYINKSFSAITGYTTDEILGKNPRIFASGKRTKNDYQRMWETILSGETWEGEFINKRKNSELYWVHSRIRAIYKQKEILAYVAVIEDITEKKKIEEIVQQEIKLSNKILSSVSDAIFILDKKMDIIFFNTSFQDLVKLSEKEIKNGSKTEILSIFNNHPLILELFANENLNTELLKKPLMLNDIALSTNSLSGMHVDLVIQKFSFDQLMFIMKPLHRTINIKGLEYFKSMLLESFYFTIYKKTDIGPTVCLTTFTETDQFINIKYLDLMGVFYMTTLGMGNEWHIGLFGPLPIYNKNESGVEKYPILEDYCSLVYSIELADKNNKDPRTPGRSYCLFVITMPENVTNLLSNKKLLTKKIKNFLASFSDVNEIDKSHINLFRDDLVHNLLESSVEE